jgi:hypothetical protein
MLRKSERYLPLIYSQEHSNRNIIGEISHNLTAMRNYHITKQQKPTIKLYYKTIHTDVTIRSSTYITDTKKSLTINGNQSMQISVKREVFKYL